MPAKYWKIAFACLYTVGTWVLLARYHMPLLLLTGGTLLLAGTSAWGGLDRRYALEGEGDSPGILVIVSIIGILAPPIVCLGLPHLASELLPLVPGVSYAGQVRKYDWIDYASVASLSLVWLVYTWMPFGCYALIDRICARTKRTPASVT
jgi:hypothetical protein